MYFEILLTELITKDKTLVQYQPISKVPSVERDLAFVVKEDIPAIDLVKAIYSVDKKLIKKLIFLTFIKAIRLKLVIVLSLRLS